MRMSCRQEAIEEYMGAYPTQPRGPLLSQTRMVCWQATLLHDQVCCSFQTRYLPQVPGCCSCTDGDHKWSS